MIIVDENSNILTHIGFIELQLVDSNILRILLLLDDI